MMKYPWDFSQSETEKYFEWIIICYNFPLWIINQFTTFSIEMLKLQYLSFHFSLFESEKNELSAFWGFYPGYCGNTYIWAQQNWLEVRVCSMDSSAVSPLENMLRNPCSAVGTVQWLWSIAWSLGQWSVSRLVRDCGSGNCSCASSSAENALVSRQTEYAQLW